DAGALLITNINRIDVIITKMKTNKKKLENFLKLFLVVSFLFLIYLIVWLNITAKQTEDNIYDVLIGEPIPKAERKIFYLNPSLKDFFIEKDLFNIDRVEYKTKNYDVAFKYPSDFRLVKDKINTRENHKEGKEWEDIYFQSYSRKQKVGFGLKINPGDIGIPINKRFKVTSENGIKQVVLEKVYDYSNDGNGMIEEGRMILDARWKEGDDWFWFIFSYQTDSELDGIDYEKMFKDIIKSINSNNQYE
ncbi:hypothetical protein KKC45_01210, partial [Patescibacteria group bacterium]|nr:hypothetical protein [Patescibacteria group bacterium]